MIAGSVATFEFIKSPVKQQKKDVKAKKGAVKRAKPQISVQTLEDESLKTRGAKRRRLDDAINFQIEKEATRALGSIGPGGLGLMVQNEVAETPTTGASLVRYEVVEKNQQKKLVARRVSKRHATANQNDVAVDESLDYE